jgi:hypothetical protein
MRTWRDHTKEWRQEGPQSADLKTKALQLYSRASALPRKGQPRGPATIPSRTNLVLLLRASGLMHEYLNDKAHATDQEALYLAGQITEGLTQTNFWTYPEDYYLACISANKTSPWAKKCADKFNRITAAN